MSDEPVSGKSGSTLYIDLAMIGLVIVVILLAISPATRPLAIAVGAGVPFGLGILIFLYGIFDMWMKRDKSTGDADFSSFPPNEERMFVGHEKMMRANASRANLIGFGLAGVLLVLGIGITVGLYTPCTQFCDHPPTSCKNEKQVADFHATCESTCGKLEGMSGLQVLKAVEGTGGGGGEGGSAARKELAPHAVSGSEYVSALSACSFANGAGPVCEPIVKKATEMGLWCPE